LYQNEENIEGLLKGIPVSEGIAIGKAWVVKSPWDEVLSFSIKKIKIDAEINRYLKAINDVSLQLVECRNRVQHEIGREESEIFNAHLSILKDPFFQKEIPDSIQKHKKNAEYLLKEGIERLKPSFSRMKNDYFTHRIDDIQDVAVRILKILLQSEEVGMSFDEPTILIAHNLTPSEIARIDRDKILGFSTELGGETSHVAILAHSMGLPAVVGVEKLMRIANNGDAIIVDGNLGIVYINPHQRILRGYKRRKQQFAVYWKRLSEQVKLPAVTTDNVNISLQANISITADVSLAVRYEANGIGLLRTEFPFLIAGKLLSEEEQFQIYKTIVESMDDKVVTIRTLDLGGDKFLPFQGVEEESNPFLGWRSIRIFLQEKDVFKTQLRAILRASNYGNVNIMYPMISSLAEIVEINKVLEETKEELKKEGLTYNKKMKNGIMIEVPSAAILADRLIQYVDYFSIGTNDLIQYTLAVDRDNEKVARFYQPLNLSVLRLIQGTIVAANKAGKPVSMCGEMASNPLYTGLLLGFGLREFSMSPLMLPEVKERIRAISVKECEDLSDVILKTDSSYDIEKKLRQFHIKANKRQSIPCIEKSEHFIED
jgi:phosphotransferase system enzyme I (PtsI)